MRPGDHPEFFRFPAPPGRSRESTIVLDRNGRFLHDGAPVEHPGMARAFSSWIARHPDDGRFILTNGYDWTYFTVEDVPFFVRSVRVRDGKPWLELSDGTEEELAASTLEVGEGDAVYAEVKNGTFRAKFTPAAQTALEPWLVAGENGGVCVQIGQSFTSVRGVS
jgi:hypothetical protein